MPGLIGRGEVLKFTCMHKGNYTCLVLSRRVIQRGLCERRGEINFMGCCHGPERRQWRRWERSGLGKSLGKADGLGVGVKEEGSGLSWGFLAQVCGWKAVPFTEMGKVGWGWDREPACWGGFGVMNQPFHLGHLALAVCIWVWSFPRRGLAWRYKYTVVASRWFSSQDNDWC